MKYRIFLLSALLMTAALNWGQSIAQEDKRSEAELIAALNVPDDSDASVRQFSLAAKQLAVTGTEAAIPALAAKLDSERFSHFARYGLETNPSPKVDEVLFDALKIIKDTKRLVGVINTIGERKNPQLIEELPRLNMQTAVFTASLAAIGNLGTPEAANALLDVITKGLPDQSADHLSQTDRAAIGDAAFRCAELLFRSGNAEKAVELYDAVAATESMPGYVREAAIYDGILARKADGLAVVVKNLTNENWNVFTTALKAARELPGENVGAALLDAAKAEENGNLSSERKAIVLEAVANRYDKAVLPELIAGVKSDNQTIRLASIRGLKYVGDASAVDALLAVAVQTGEENVAASQAASYTLVWIPGETVDAKIVDVLKNGNDAARIVATKLVEERRIKSAFPVLSAAVVDKNKDVRKVSLEAIAETAGLEEIPVLYELLAKASADEDIADLQRALKSAAGRQSREPAAEFVISLYQKAEGNAKLFLLELLATVGGDKAVDFVSSQAWISDRDTVDKASAVLGNWADASQHAQEALLKIAKEPKHPFQRRGIRGYIRFARQFNMNEDERINISKTVFDIASNREDKALVFDVISRNPTEKMLAYSLTFFDNDDFKEDAFKAAVAVGNKVQGKPAILNDAMKKVVEATKNAEAKEQAQRILDRK
ncbi:MAG: hypothetical protein LBJ67_07290 [Planctomycetaceae bacterium]|jgi:HEAT repeat protein|nr:hypothetical protein [Planctomycetaceae bacterium]